MATITIENNGTETFSLALTTITGQLAREVPYLAGNTFELEKGNLAPGIYFLKIANDKGRFTTKKVVFN